MFCRMWRSLTGKQSQYRSCNNPATAIGGTDCVGDGVNSVSCNDHPCPVNGKFSDWGQWSSCIVNSGCQGYRERERSCNTPAPQHGGVHCTGSVENKKLATIASDKQKKKILFSI
ncbi:thrombospondin-2-like [Mytilus edulis]|uniref:thrombospondin-2-like n=1 Tax=Mytilus edulis TaxID=6550 RepID=UPI0039EFB80B